MTRGHTLSSSIAHKVNILLTIEGHTALPDLLSYTWIWGRQGMTYPVFCNLMDELQEAGLVEVEVRKTALRTRVGSKVPSMTEKGAKALALYREVADMFGEPVTGGRRRL